MRQFVVGVGTVALLSLAACGQNVEERAASGGVGGAAAGAVIGGPVGAVVGGAAGATGGTMLDKGLEDESGDATRDQTAD